MSWSFAHPHVIQDVHVFLSSVEKKLRIEEIKYFLHIGDFNGIQWIEGPNCSFSAASKGSTRAQLRNKGLI